MHNKNPTLHREYLRKMLQCHLLLSFSERRGGKQLLLGVIFVQVVTDDGRLVYQLTSKCLHCWDKSKRIHLKEPLGLVFQVDVDDLMSERQKQNVKSKSTQVFLVLGVMNYTV